MTHASFTIHSIQALGYHYGSSKIFFMYVIEKSILNLAFKVLYRELACM
jgi:hypothetical protein